MHRFLLFIFLLCLHPLIGQAQTQTGSGTILQSGTQEDTSQLGLQERVDTLVRYVRNQFYKKNYDQTIEVGEATLKFATQINDQKSAAKVSSLMGNAFLQIDDTLQAKRIFSEALTIAQKRKDSSNMLGARIDLANIYAIQKDYGPAITNFKLALPLAKQIKDTIRLFILNYNIAELYMDSEQVEEADYYATETGKYVAALNANAYRAGYELLLGRLFYLQKKPDSAIVHLQKNIQLSIESDFAEGLIEGYDYYAKAEAEKGNYEKAYDLQQKVDLYKSEQYKTDKIGAIETVTARFNLKQYKQELKATELQNQLNEQKAARNSTFLFWVLVATGILCIYLLSLLISYRKRKKLVLELKDKNKKYLMAKERSEELTIAKSKFFSNMSHELRTPLYGIIGISSILMDDESLKEHKEDVKSLKFSADYLLALINDVLQVNKLDATKDMKLNKATFNLNELVNGIIKSFEFMRAQNSNTFEVIIDERIPELLVGDNVKLSQILINLIGNACKFTENGVIALHITKKDVEGEEVCLHFSLKDTGIGISQERQKNIFDEFTQVTHKSTYAGTGLGLPIVKKLLALHHSEVELKSEIGQGTQIDFELCYGASAEKFIETKILQGRGKSVITSKKIMVVDDNRINQIVTRKILERHGATAVVANSGQEAIALAKQEQLDLILMDINMPGMNGFEATAIIKESNPKIPVIALTAVEMDEMQEKIDASLINDVVVKPYDVNVFIEIILRNLP